MIPMIILVGFFPNIDFHDSKFNEKPIKEINGTIVSVLVTNNSVNGEKALEFKYEFNLDNIVISGTSFGFEDSFSIGDSVDIEYLINDPSISRIVGTKNGSFGIDSFSSLLGFVMLGLIVLIITIYKKIEALRIFSSGFDILPSTLDSELKTPTLPVGKSNPFYRLKFNYNISGNIYSKVIYTSQDEYTMRRIRMSSIIVDSHNNSISVVLETLPNKMRNYIVEKSTIANKGNRCTSP